MRAILLLIRNPQSAAPQSSSAARVNGLFRHSLAGLLFRFFGLLRPLLLEERGLVLHVSDERVYDRFGEAEYGGAEQDAGDAEGVDSCDEADEHPVEVEALGGVGGELRAHDQGRECSDERADEEVRGGCARLVPEDEQVDADGDVDRPLAEQREEADEEDYERERDGERHAEEEVHQEVTTGLRGLGTIPAESAPPRATPAAP